MNGKKLQYSELLVVGASNSKLHNTNSEILDQFSLRVPPPPPLTSIPNAKISNAQTTEICRKGSPTILVKQKILNCMILFVRHWSLKLSCRVFKYLIKCTLQTLFVLQLVRIHHACVSFVWKLFKNFSSHCIF